MPRCDIQDTALKRRDTHDTVKIPDTTVIWGIDSMVHRIGSNLRRPYAPAATFLETINRFRRRQLPDSVDNDRLGATGLTRATTSRVLFGLLFLGLITEAGTPTQNLQALVRSGDQDYRD